MSVVYITSNFRQANGSSAGVKQNVFIQNRRRNTEPEIITSFDTIIPTPCLIFKFYSTLDELFLFFFQL